jgi:sulfatase modifying factor 1
VEHQVTLTRAFYMQTTEVTRKQWESIMGRSFFSRRYQDELPIVKVSWFDCTEFIKKLNALKEGTYRLPTEAEWEYACLAGGSGPYPWGNSIRCADAMYANNPDKAEECVKYVESRGMRPDSPAPDKSYPPNAWGLYDMPGNVWEWCSDWYGPYPQNPVSGPTGLETGTVKVRRGGSWFGQGWLCRCANRNFSHPGDRYATLGLRLVREIP